MRVMYRILAMISLSLLCVLLTNARGAHAEEVGNVQEHKAEVWSPVEITLTSAVDYDNPYLATEIDAIFTHTDGTTITLPGFWKEGSTWAVRFSPTKVGDWTYVVTCKDTLNAGLNAAGVIHAAEATKDTDIAEHGFVVIEQGKHYYQHADGTPFFWLGDTNWQGVTHIATDVCNYPGCTCGNQFQHIVNNRLEKGFNVFQTYFVPEGGNGEPSPWLDSEHEQPATDVFNSKIDKMFEYLHENGMVVALGLGCHTATMRTMELEDVLRFTRYVVARYACYSVVWISGQEIDIEGDSKTEGYSSFDCYLELSALIEELDGYKHPNSAHMWPGDANVETKERLDNCEWHDSWLVQGGHGIVQPQSYYRSFYTANRAGFEKPFIESEANYEEINCGGFTGYELNRKSAWKSILCGSAGFTYGTTGIWINSFSTSVFTRHLGETSDYSYEPWYIGLDKPGSFEMAYMKNFFENIGPWWDLIPRPNTRFDNFEQALFMENGEESVLASTDDGSLIVCYFYADTDDISFGRLYCLNPEMTYFAYWFDPRTGKYIPIADGIRAEDGRYSFEKKPDKSDWVFLMTSIGLQDYSVEDAPKDLNPCYELVEPTGTKVTPISVKAIGGITYMGSQKDNQTMIDNTNWLYDGDSATVWIPFANRTTQTFLFDLGILQNLSHVTITPDEGTIIPRFRVEGSNDGKDWTIIANTAVRDNKNPGVGSEPLSGVYRYVKILLLNAENIQDVSSVSYETIYNPASDHSYAVTRIADITIYASEEETPGEQELESEIDENNNEEAPVEKNSNPGNKNIIIAISCAAAVGLAAIVGWMITKSK